VSACSRRQAERRTHSADHANGSSGEARIAALVNSLRIVGSSGGIRICSALYMGSVLAWAMASLDSGSKGGEKQRQGSGSDEEKQQQADCCHGDCA
jgi:hypothetical protein